MKLNIAVKKSEYFRTLLSFLKEIAPFSELRPRELDVFGELLSYNHKYRDIPKEDRMTILFNYNTRARICATLGISKDTLYNLMKGLRDKEIISQTEILNGFDKIFIIHDKLEFNFNIEEEDE